MNAHKKKRVLHGEDCLGAVEAIKLVLEDGKTYSFRIANEVGPVPSDPVRLAHEARRAHARLAFWSAQEQRALAQLRVFERLYARAAGIEYQAQRRLLAEFSGSEIPTEANVRARMDVSVALKTEKERVEEAQKRYGVLRALREALEHRSHLLRRLVTHTPEFG